MNEKIFREKSLKRIKSPESLGDYIRISSPAVWIILAAVLLLLVGACVWGFAGKIETTAECNAVAKDGEVICLFDAANLPQISVGMPVRIDGAEYPITRIDAEHCFAYAYADVPDGNYKLQIIIESIRPCELLFGKGGL